MRAIISAAVVASAAVIAVAAPGVADARTVGAGTTVEYGWISDMVQNQVSYYGKDGKLVTRQVRFRYLPIGFGPEKFGYGVKIRTTKSQKVQSRATSSGAFSSCTVKINGRQVASNRNNGGGTSRC